MFALSWLVIAIGERETMNAIDRELSHRVRSIQAQPPLLQPIRPPDFTNPDGMEQIEATQSPGPRFPQIRRPRFIGLGAQIPGGNQEPFLPLLVEQSRQGKTLYGITQVDGFRVRVISAPFGTKDFGTGVIQLAQEIDALSFAGIAQTRTTAIAIPFSALLALILGFILSRTVLQPIQRITHVAGQIANSPDAVERIEWGSSDEIGKLALAFNTMTNRLQSGIESQRRFTGDAAHELRTPLASMLLATENALHPDASEQEKLDALASIKRNAESMSKLTTTLLELSRSDSGKTPLELAETDLHSAAIAATASFPAERIEFLGDWRGEKVMANSGALEQIIRNLVENALAYSPPGTKIRIAYKNAELSIKDSGPGIPPEAMPHIFDRFYRVDPSRTRALGGHGLGLSIVQELAAAQRITVTADSNSAGSTFSLHFHNADQCKRS
jgi:signal transduction histidine kinase